jgi:hypothetical protein
MVGSTFPLHKQVMTPRKKAEKRITIPRMPNRADDVRARLAQIGIDESDITAAVSWARKFISKA